MRYLALDIGKRRIGVAVSDPLGLVARPLRTLKSVSLNADVAAVTEVARELEAEAIVVGDPLHMSGDAGIMSDRAHKFGEALRAASGLPIEYCDERLTSVEAQRILQESGVPPKKARQQIDAVAAAVILQSYLNTLKPPRSPNDPLEDRYR
ncbi:MAG: Holliday junction resolvase RuvX [Chloroflexia bacterium]